MAVQTPPFALQNASHSAALFRQAASSQIPSTGGVLGSGELACTAQSTPNMSVQVAPGRAWIPGTQVGAPAGMSWTTQALYFALNDAAVSVTVAAADPTNPRIDVVYVQVQDAFYSGSVNSATVGIVTGTPAPTPAVPAVPSNSIVLAHISVPANATSIGSGQITNELGPPINLLLAPPLFVGEQHTSQSIPNAAWTAVTLDTNVEDSASGHSTTVNPTRYTAQIAGWYLLAGSIFLNSYTASFLAAVRIQINGAALPRSEQQTLVPAGATATLAVATTYAYLNVGDYVELGAYQSSSVALTLEPNSNAYSFMSAKLDHQ